MTVDERVAVAGLSADSATALQNDLTLLTDALIAREDELTALYNLTRSARACLDSAALFAAFLSELAQLFHSTEVFAVQIVAGNEVRCYRGADCTTPEETLIALGSHALDRPEQPLHHNRLPAGWSACLFTPVAVDGKPAGGLGIGRTADEFSWPERKLLRVIAEHAAAHLENVLLQETRLARVRLQSEMALAHDVQQSLLPRRLPQVPGIELAATALPALEVGGDFHDCIVGDSSLTLAVGDVAGKGMPAALLMGMTRTTLRNATHFLPDATPATIMAQMNTCLYSDFTGVGLFATLFVARYDPASRLLHYANAGHSPVICCPAGGTARLLEADGIPLGVLPDTLVTDCTLPLAAGDLLVVASDGLNEARDSAGTLFGYERLLRLVQSLAPLPAAQIVQQLAHAVTQYRGDSPQDDDQTILVLKGVPL
jgi:sigma-B regulation protein RsbU (phosphoserine phosphatase)